MPEQEPPNYGLVMPFVCCKSNGGVYEDAAFVAGARFGQAQERLRGDGPSEWSGWVEPEMVAQYDLLAMQSGFTMTAEPWDEHPDEWVLVDMRRTADEPPRRRTVVLWALVLGLVAGLGTYLLAGGHHQSASTSFHWWDWVLPGIVGWMARGVFDDQSSRRRRRREDRSGRGEV